MSYLVRRAMCGLTPKNYNNVFLQLLKRFDGPEATADSFHQALASLEGQASRWPGDDEFRKAWLTESAHSRMGDVGRISAMLVELENSMRSPHAEEPFVPGPGMLDVDHILPEKWYAHWPLDGAPIAQEEASQAFLADLGIGESSSRQEAILRRERLKATFGDLTLAHYGINRSAQHDGFETKRKLFFAESNLHLNRVLMLASAWDDLAIEERGQDLFEIARKLWKGPTSTHQ
jgi:hypothetical protein